MQFKIKIYNQLVNRHTGICTRYHNFHDGTSGAGKIISWFYLIWLNFAYYILQCRFLGRVPEMAIYEEKRLNCEQSESEENEKHQNDLSVEKFVNTLSEYEIVSFDVFDTLLFRSVSLPTDVFYFIGQELGILDFKNIRIKAEQNARVKKKKQKGNMEITFSDIWDEIEAEVGVSSELGQKLELSIEEKVCYANPFMLSVWEELQKKGKTVIIVSDMYLPEKCIEKILTKQGFYGAKKIYVSNEYEKSKADGTLFQEVLTDWYGKEYDTKKVSMIHVGDNPHSDQKQAKKAGLAILPYQNVNRNVLLYRAFDLSPIVGSAYRAMVSNRLYCGLYKNSMEYEYGYIYGGLFVVGYCAFIRDYCKKNGVDKVLFLSRDGDTLKQAYHLLYPEENVEYVYWSRKAATKLETAFDKHDFFRRFLSHKVNQNYSVREIFESMELEFLLEKFDEPNVQLTDKNELSVRRFIEKNWDLVKERYQTQSRAAQIYYGNVLEGRKKAVAVDIGWAGSGAMVLRHLVSKEWQMSCELIGIIAGTNTVHNAEADASEMFLQSGQLVAYLYSQRHNRDLLKKHDANKDYNVFWELLLSSPTPQFRGFYMGNVVRENTEDVYLPDKNITLQFGKYDANQNGIREIQRGILQFVCDYKKHFEEFPCLFSISGRDAYAPMLVAASYDEKYLKMIEKKFNLEINVN